MPSNNSTEKYAFFPDNSTSCLSVKGMLVCVNDVDVSWLRAIGLYVGIVYAFITIVALALNVTAIASMFINERLKRQPSNTFILNLLTADVLLCIFVVTFSPIVSLMSDWPFGGWLCCAIPVVICTCIFVTTWSHVTLALDKFIHINNPLRPPTTVKQARMITIVTWVVSSIVSLPRAIGFGVDRYMGGSFCLYQRSSVGVMAFNVVANVTQYAIPVTIISICYALIFVRINKDMLVCHAQYSTSVPEPQRLAALHRRRRVLFILVSMVAAFIICWTPLVLHNIINDFGWKCTDDIGVD